jgi:hypothetical protein
MSPKRQNYGPGNLVIAIYSVFALAATVRALYQLVRKYEEAPLSYWLSLLAGLVYLIATYALSRGKYSLAQATLIFELTGVICVGFMSVIEPNLFAHPSVWSYFGLGYGLIPLVLPIFGLWWIRRVRA